MITDFKNKTAVLTGAGSGFGLECARIGASLGMNLVLADVQQDALDKAAEEMRTTGVPVLALRLDVSKASEMEALGDAVHKRFGAPHFVFNNAGVACGGLIWETSVKEWEWLLGVNVMGVAHGVRVFTPMMLEAARADPAYQGHIVNTASMAGLLNPPNMGVYNVSKHAVVALSEDAVPGPVAGDRSDRRQCVVPVLRSHRHHQQPAQQTARLARRGCQTQQKPADRRRHDRQGRELRQGFGGGRGPPVFDGISANRFYIYSHPRAIKSVQTRMEDIMLTRNPSDPFAERPEIGAKLKEALRSAV